MYSKKSEDNVLRQYRKKAEKQKETAALYPYGTGGQSFQILSIETEEYGNEIRAYELSLFKISDQKIS